jgi:hypothetical protein
MPDLPAETITYPLVDARCDHRSCGPAISVYRCIGECANCGNGPYLILVTSGHTMPSNLWCPKCGCYDVRSSRLAADYEIPDGSSVARH